MWYMPVPRSQDGEIWSEDAASTVGKPVGRGSSTPMARMGLNQVYFPDAVSKVGAMQE